MAWSKGRGTPRKRDKYKASRGQGAGHLALLRATPFLFAGCLFLLAPGLGLVDVWLHVTRPPQYFLGSFSRLPESLSTPLKSSLGAPSPSSGKKQGIPELVYTRYRIKKGETLSQLAWKFGLNPATVVSVNNIEHPQKLRPGFLLIIPYKDGMRVSLSGTKTPAGEAQAWGLALEEVKRLPSLVDKEGKDLFLPGIIPPPDTLPRSLRETFLFPVQGLVARPFGLVEDKLTGIPYQNQGIDLSAPKGTSVAASRSGAVVSVGTHPSYGNYLIMAHLGGWKSFYGHLENVYVKQGARAGQGEILGTLGHSGTAREPLLHFVLIKGNKVVDPLKFLL